MPFDPFGGYGGPPPPPPLPPPVGGHPYPLPQIQPYNPTPYDFNQDPWYLEALSEAARARALYDAQEYEARRQALISLGGDLSGLGLTAEDLAAAAANDKAGYSILARLAHTHEQRQRSMINQLAGRGMIYSGETGHQTLEEGRRFGNEQRDARAKVLDYLRQLAGQKLEREEAIRQMLRQARGDAYQRGLDRPPPAFPGIEPLQPSEPLTYGQLTKSPLYKAAPSAKSWLKTVKRPKPKTKFGLAI